MPPDSSLPDVVPSRRSFHRTYKSEPADPSASQFGPPGPISDNLVERVLQLDPGYDRQLAYAMAVVSGWSYADDRTLANKLKYYGLPSATIEEMSVINPAMSIVATAFFIRSRCGRIGILSFRGTEPSNLVNWLTDTDTVPRRFGNGKVHRGFYANLQALWDEIGRALRDAIEPNASNGHSDLKPMLRLYITGHSLGAAMAVLAAAKIWKDEARAIRNALHGIYTFGQPAVGDAAFVKEFAPLFGDKLFRHAYGYDVVPHLPPVTTGDYQHFGSVRITNGTKDAWTEPSKASQQARDLVLTIATCLASFVGRRIPLLSHLEARLFKYSFFDDHSPTYYIETSRSALTGD